MVGMPWTLAPQNVKGGVPHHHHLAGVADLGEKIGDDVLLGLPACVQGGPADALEVTGQLEMLQHLLGGDLGLGGGHEKTVSRTLQPVQQSRQCRGRGCFQIFQGTYRARNGQWPRPGTPGEPEAGKALPQGGPTRPELIAVRHLDAKMARASWAQLMIPGPESVRVPSKSKKMARDIGGLLSTGMTLFGYYTTMGGGLQWGHFH